MPRLSDQLVSVVVPMHNAAATIDRTLDSVRRQSWPDLEIIVVDDGSSDDGPFRVRAHAASDRRVRLIGQDNGGVAAARNHGAQAARGDYLAFVDADDLWGPEKIDLQMQALWEGGPDAGVAYTWAALIDHSDRVYSLAHRPLAEGQVFRDLCRANVVGNGSSVLIRRAAFEAVGGYDSSLRARGAQGCEDLMIYLRLAEITEFRVVRRHLTGYRVSHGNMSSDALRMLRSCELTLDRFRPAYPQYAAEFDAHRRDMVYWLLVRALTTGPVGNIGALLAMAGPRISLSLVDRLGDLAWLTARARAPAWMKSPVLRLMSGGRAFRPHYSEVAG